MNLDTSVAAGHGVTLDSARLNGFHAKLALFSSGGPFLDGYILSIIGIAMVQIQPQWDMSALWAGLIGSSALIGVFLGGAVFGPITDRIGRKLMYTIDLVAIIVCSVLQFFAQDVWQLFVLRLIIGIAVGADYPIATALVTESAPKAWRAKLVGGLNAMWFVGATVAAFVGYLLLSLPDGWRWMLLSSAIPAAVIVVARTTMPESPRWLLSKGRSDEALAVLRRTIGAQATFDDLPAEEGTTTIRGLMRGGYLRRVVFISVFWTCTIVTLFAIYAFGPQILELFNLGSGDLAHIGYGLINLFFLIGNIVALLLVDRLGRRPILIWGFVLSGIGLLFLAIRPDAALWMIAIAFAVYALFNGGPSILEWIYPNELFPTEVRATAVGLCTGISRIGAAIGTFATPWALTNLGLSATMYIAAGIAGVGAVVSFLMAPETRGTDLSDAASLR
ncbi:metabolite transporter [Mycolicibacterium wolinskyi]|uniref:Metabolite transporter n=1 Tax=Mycolicibacterium wolinskyi TaxID=59750 RepID=A0A132PN33_9MYCO|nr:MFS transporter [Mycolicibacterium wolinskyi]KWX23674.1 metabolite transporter [Mycolicibacterium wolinskyi]